MKSPKLLVGSLAALLLIWGIAFGQDHPPNQNTPAPNNQSTSGSTQSPSTQAPATPVNPATTENPAVSSSSANTQGATKEKEKHWSGTLVDASCMAKALSSMPAKVPGGAGGSASPSGVPQFAPQNPDQFQQSSPAGGAGQATGGAGMQRGATGTSPTYPGQESGQNPDMSQQQSAQAAAAQRVDTATKQCGASASTQQFALAMSGGTVVRFDNDGDSKAADALKSVEVQPGKKVKAKVTGVLAENNVVRVDSVEVKGKKAASAAPMGAQGVQVK